MKESHSTNKTEASPEFRYIGAKGWVWSNTLLERESFLVPIHLRVSHRPERVIKPKIIQLGRFSRYDEE